MPTMTEISDSKRVSLDGQEMLVDLRDKVISRRLAAGGVYDPNLRRIIRRHVSPGMVVVDVGAHIGWQTVLMSRQADESGTVWAIEPAPRNMQFLRANLELNECKNVRAIDMAAWDFEARRLDLYFSPTNTGDHSLIDDSSRKSAPVMTMKLDTIGYADFIKIDAQGSEHAILRGARELIANSPGLVMVVEYWPKGLSAFGDPMGMIAELRKNFEIEVVGGAIDLGSALGALTPGNGKFVNLLCKRKEQER